MSKKAGGRRRVDEGCDSAVEKERAKGGNDYIFDCDSIDGHAVSFDRLGAVVAIYRIRVRVHVRVRVPLRYSYYEYRTVSYPLYINVTQYSTVL